MNLLLEQLFSAIVLGGVYALVAVSMTFIYSVSKQIQLAHGGVMVIGAYVGFFVARWTSNLIAALLVAGLVCGVLGLVINDAIFRWLRGSGHIYLVAGLALSAIIAESLRLSFYAGHPITYPASVGGGHGVPTGLRFAILGLSLAAGVGFQLFLFRTQRGRALRSVADNAEAARLLGVSHENMVRLGFIIGSAMAGMAGVLLALIYQYVTPYLGEQIGLVAVAIVLFGGLGSIPGALIGSFIVAFSEILTTTYVSSGYKDAVTFALIIAIIRLRPQGIFGRKANLRA